VLDEVISKINLGTLVGLDTEAPRHPKSTSTSQGLFEVHVPRVDGIHDAPLVVILAWTVCYEFYHPLVGRQMRLADDKNHLLCMFGFREHQVNDICGFIVD